MHMLSKKDLTSDELETLRRSRNPTVVVTANGKVQTNEEAQVYVHDLGLFVIVQLLEDTRAVLSLGKLCEDHRYSYEWQSGQKPRLTKQGQLYAKRTISYLLLFQGCLPVLVLLRLQHRQNRTCLHQVPSQSEVTNQHQATGARQTHKPKTKIKRGMTFEIRTNVCEIFLKGWSVRRQSCARTDFSGLRFATSYESGIKIMEAQNLHSLPKKPKLRRMPANQNYKGPLQKTHW